MLDNQGELGMPFAASSSHFDGFIALQRLFHFTHQELEKWGHVCFMENEMMTATMLVLEELSLFAHEDPFLKLCSYRGIS